MVRAMGRVLMEYWGLTLCLVLSMLFAGCSAVSLDSTRETDAGRKTLSAVELDALTASGESNQATIADPSAAPNGFETQTPGLANPTGPLPSSPNGGVQFSPTQPLAVPNLAQFNSIRQVR
jgi:hypothetical protein